MGNQNSIGVPEDIAHMKKYFGMTMKLIIKIKDRLELLAEEDLSIDRESFQIAMKTKSDETNKIFGLFDFSNEGKIDTLEFICALTLISHSTLIEKSNVIFGLYDFDKNRTMNKNELIILIKTILTSLNAMCKKGECTIAEGEAMAEEILRRYDTNKDASISMKEFYSFVSKDPDIIRMLLSYGLISKEDLHFNFGLENSEIPDADSDLEAEIMKSRIQIDERSEKISLGIEHNYRVKEQIMKEEEKEEQQQEKEEEQEGTSKNQFPWVQQVQDCIPDKYLDNVMKQSYKADSNSPAASLEIDYIYGYRGFDTRNNLKYSQKDELLYHCGAIAIALDPVKNTQRFFMEHTDDITCIDVGENYAITGQLGTTPLTCLWEVNSMEPKAIIKGLLKVGISNISISNNEKLFIAIGMDDLQCIAIYDIDKLISARATGKRDDSLVASGKGPRSEIFDVKFDKSDKTVVIACKGEVNFVTFENQNIKVLNSIKHNKILKGQWESKMCPIQSVISIGLLDNSVVTGTFKGQLILWRGSRSSQAVDAHKGPVQAIHSMKQEVGVITGGRDGNIIFWDGSLKIRKKIILSEICKELSSFRITALCERSDGRLGVGTRGGDIIQISQNSTVSKIMRGHFYGNLKGLVVHPSLHIFYTVGEDSWLMKWSCFNKTLMRSLKLEYQSRAMDISPNKQYLTIGCHNGNVLVLDPDLLNKLMDFKDRDSEISCVKFTPDSEYFLIAYSSPYCEIFIYNVKQHFKKCSIINGFEDDVMSIDFQKENYRIAMIPDASQKLWFLDMTKETQPILVTRGEELYKNCEWFTYNSIYGWHVQGIWPEVSGGNDINAVDRAKTIDVLVTGDDYSGLKLFRYPSYMPLQSFNRYSGHSNQISNVRFTCDDTFLISLGGQEKSIIQWKFSHDNQLQSDYDKSFQHIAQLGVATAIKRETEQSDFEEDDDNEEKKFTQLKSGTQQKTNVQKKQNIRPFEAVIKQMIPTNAEMQEKTIESELPNQLLNLQYVIGSRTSYESHNMYNVLHYNLQMKVVFPVAGLCVVMETKPDLKTGQIPQSFFTRHTQDIISLALHPKGVVAATGTALPNFAQNLVEIMVWDTETKNLICIIQDFHISGISHLQFSPDGTLLLTVGMDLDHSLAIYDWQSNRLLCTSKVDKQSVYDIGWRSNHEFFTIGEKHFKIWSVKGRNLRSNYANFNGNFEPQTAVAFAFGSECVTGNEKGYIQMWKDNCLGPKYQAHGGRVNCLVGTKSNLYSAGEDGKIILWIYGQNILQQSQVLVDLHKKQYDTHGLIGITSLQVRNDIVTFMTRESQILEVTNGSPTMIQVILNGTFGGQMKALAVHPTLQLFVTGASDGRVRLWDANKRQELFHKAYDCEISSLDWSSDGHMVAMGNNKGKIYILEFSGTQQTSYILTERSHKVTKFHSMKTSEGSYSISKLAFSPESNQLAFGGYGGPSHVEICKLDGFKLLKESIEISVGFTNSLSQLDWSIDSQFIAATSEGQELKFISVTKQRDIQPSSIKDEEWAKWTCIYGYSVQGIYPYSFGNDIETLSRSSKKDFLISGDSFGAIRLYKYPSTIRNSLCSLYNGHKGQIAVVKLTGDDTILISIGRQDQSIIIWSVEQNQNLQYVPLKLTKEEESQRRIGISMQIKQMQIVTLTEKKTGLEKFGKMKQDEKNNILQYKQVETFADSEESMDEQDKLSQNYIYMKPWINSLKEPISYYKDPPNQSTAPRIDLQLDYSHGYRSNDCRNNVRYLKNGFIVYHTAGLAIVMDIENNIQKFFNRHLDDIISLDLNRDGIRVATGELGLNPSVYVWDSNTLQPLCFFSNIFSLGVCSLNFSPSGEKLSAVALDLQHSVFVLDINTKSINGGSLIAKEYSGVGTIVEVKWRTDTEFVTIGPYHLRMWQVTCVGLLCNTITIPTENSGMYVTCCLRDDEMFIGDANGNIQVWKAYQYLYSIKAHDNMHLDAMFLSQEVLITGGRDHKINIFELCQSLQAGPLISFKLSEIVKTALMPEIRSIQISEDNKNLLIGTYGGEIWELSTKESKLSQAVRYTYPRPIVKGHYCVSKERSNEIWGLAFNPIDTDLYYTCGDDATLRVWSLSQKKMVSIIKTNQDINSNEIKPDENGEISDGVRGRSIAVSQDGQFVVVGFKDGGVRVFDRENKQKSYLKIAKEWISDLKFSPNGQILAIGSHDNRVYLYRFPEFVIIHKPLRKHSEFIKNIDFSCDGNKIHTSCGGYDFMFWDVTIPKQLPKGHIELRDEHWHTWTSLLGWPVQGIWGETSDGSDINCVDRSHNNYSGENKAPDNYYFLAVGNDYNEIKIYRYPCVVRGSQAIIGRGHSSPVSCIKWSHDDSYLVSIGGEDMSIIQWKVIKQ